MCRYSNEFISQHEDHVSVLSQSTIIYSSYIASYPCMKHSQLHLCIHQKCVQIVNYFYINFMFV